MSMPRSTSDIPHDTARVPLEGRGADGGFRAPPSRHCADVPTARRTAARLRWMIRHPVDPDADGWSAMGQALWRGDPLADAVVAWMHELGMARAWGVFERALQQGPDSADLPAPLSRLMAHAHEIPAWVDPAQMALGARVLQGTGLHGMRVLRDAGLMAGYQASAINQTLVKTGALSKGATRRVAETTSWWLACVDEGGMAPGAAGFTMTLRVRVLHALVRHQMRHRPDWDAERHGLPVNQLDMQATYLAFSVVQLLAVKTTGLWLTRRESEAVMHLWRYIGWLMGVEEGLLCDNEAQGRLVLYHNTLSQAPADDTSVALGRALMDEPLYRHYPNLAWLRGRFNRARHLSLVRWFVGREGMRALGLPPELPWYPMLMMLPLALRATLLHAAPPLTDWLRRRGRQAQRDYLRVLMGAHRAAHLTGDAPPGVKAAG